MRLLRYSVLAIFMLFCFASSFAQIIQVGFAPPPLPVYEQPPCPDENYIWTPGYWAYDDDYDDYFWVPGTWVLAPEPGYFWTPPYWAWEDSAYVFHPGYWGPQVGFYGGIPYGYGYFGQGYQGGRWQDDHFYYNQAVTNVTNIRYVYNTPVDHDRDDDHVSYNGGNGGIDARPTPEQEAAMRERHLAPVAAQTEHVQQAHSDPQLRASHNRGNPPIAATPKPADFHGNGIVPARQAGGAYNPPANRNHAARGNEPVRNNEPPNPSQPRPEDNGRRAIHPKDLPPLERPSNDAGDSKTDQNYQKQQEKMYQQEEKQREKLQQKQDQEHQKMQKQQADQARQQQMEQRHQQQTQQLEQRQQMQREKAAPPRPVAHPQPPPGGPPH